MEQICDEISQEITQSQEQKSQPDPWRTTYSYDLHLLHNLTKAHLEQPSGSLGKKPGSVIDCIHPYFIGYLMSI